MTPQYLWLQEVVGCIDDVEVEILKNEVTVLLVPDVVCGIADIGTLEDSMPGIDGLWYPQYRIQRPS